MKMEKLAYDSVLPLKGSRAYKKMQANLKFMLSLKAEDLLYNYRKNAGLPTGEGKEMTGWEAIGMPVSGHYLGHYLSACAIAHATWHKADPQTAAMLDERMEVLLTGLQECQTALGKEDENFGFLAVFPKSQFADVENNLFEEYHFVPYYRYQKLLSGLCCVYELTGKEKALAIAKGMADYIIGRLAPLSAETIEKMIDTRWYQGSGTYIYHMEFGAMHQAVLKLYGLCGEEKYRDLAEKFRRKWFDDMMLGDEDLFGYYTCHSNTELACILGNLENYKLTGDPDDLTRVEHFLDWVENTHSFATGGISGVSSYPPPANYGGELFEYPHMMFKHTSMASGESCCSHTMNALVSDYITVTGKMTWAEQFEKRYFNAVYSQQRERDGGFIYNLNVKNGARKSFSADGFYCCNGSGVETHANLCHDLCYKNEDQIVITQYIPMEIHLEDQNVTIIQKKDLWEAQSAAFEIQNKEPVTFTLTLRLPGWSKNRQVFVNGTEYPLEKKEQVEITRCWENGDQVEVRLPFDIRLYALPDRWEYVAAYYGPFLMAYTGTEKTFAGSREAFAEEVKDEILSGNYIPLMEIKEEVYNLFTILPAENKYQTCCELSINGGSFVSPDEKWYIKMDYAPTEEEAVCFDILLNGKVRFTQSFKPKGQDYLAYVLYPVFDCPDTEITLELRPKMYEGTHYTDLSVIKKIEIVKGENHESFYHQ